MKDNKNDAKPEVEKVDQAEEKLSDETLMAVSGGWGYRPSWDDLFGGGSNPKDQ